MAALERTVEEALKGAGVVYKRNCRIFIDSRPAQEFDFVTPGFVIEVKSARFQKPQTAAQLGRYERLLAYHVPLAARPEVVLQAPNIVTPPADVRFASSLEMLIDMICSVAAPPFQLPPGSRALDQWRRHPSAQSPVITRASPFIQRRVPQVVASGEKHVRVPNEVNVRAVEDLPHAIDVLIYQYRM